MQVAFYSATRRYITRDILFKQWINLIAMLKSFNCTYVPADSSVNLKITLNENFYETQSGNTLIFLNVSRFDLSTARSYPIINLKLWLVNIQLK